MKLIAVTMRQDLHKPTAEMRDGLDVNWFDFLRQCGYTPLVLANAPESLSLFNSMKHKLCGLLLTGGNDLVDYGGQCPVRDKLEIDLLRVAVADKLPVIGVCRGMQLMITIAGGKLEKVSGHITSQQQLQFKGVLRGVNSYHNWGALETPESFIELARSDDGIVKAIQSRLSPVLGIMWHPERMSPFCTEDIDLFKGWFN